MRRSGWRSPPASLGLILTCTAALAACGGDDSGDAGAHTATVIHLTGQPQHVVLPAHKRYGIYVNDANNSGYSLNCKATDTQGHDEIHMDHKTPATISTSGTNNLDLVYDTGSGDLIFTCSAAGEQTTTRLLTGVVR
jgi:hypothetical protein